MGKMLDKIFNVRNFLILISIVALVCIYRLSRIGEESQKKAEERLNNFSMKSYEGNVRSNIDVAINYCEMNYDELSGIVIGIDANEATSSDYWDESNAIKYYIKDKDAIKKIVKELKKIEFISMVDSADEFTEKEIAWDVVFHHNTNKSYALRVRAMSTREDGCYKAKVYTVHRNNSAEEEKIWYTDLHETLGSEYQLLYNKSMPQVIKSVIDEYVTDITIDKVVDICLQEDIDLSEIFGFNHGLKESGKIEIEGQKWSEPTDIYKFPIQGTDLYLLLEKEALISNFIPKTGIIRLEIHKESGEFLNLFEADEVNVREFCQ